MLIEIECREAIEIEYGKASEIVGGMETELALYHSIRNGIWDGNRSGS